MMSAELMTKPMISEQKITTGEAVRLLRRDPQYESVIRDAYLDEDVLAAAERFRVSPEFSEVCSLLEGQVRGAKVLDIGAGTGIASYAFARSGAGIVYALEPDASEDVGRGAIMRLRAELPIEVVDASGDQIPLPDGSVDVVYARQVLHHAGDSLPGLIRESSRVLKTGGTLLVCREHVVDDDAQLQEFLASHPIHKLAGGEYAYPLSTYVAVIKAAGLELREIFGPWDSLINTSPFFGTRAELENYPATLLRERFGPAGAIASRLPWMQSLLGLWIKRHAAAGRLYSFFAVKT
jgi:SAM-dependent methyltransferase